MTKHNEGALYMHWKGVLHGQDTQCMDGNLQQRRNILPHSEGGVFSLFGAHPQAAAFILSDRLTFELPIAASGVPLVLLYIVDYLEFQFNTHASLYIYLIIDII